MAAALPVLAEQPGGAPDLSAPDLTGTGVTARATLSRVCNAMAAASA